MASPQIVRLVAEFHLTVHSYCIGPRTTRTRGGAGVSNSMTYGRTAAGAVLTSFQRNPHQ